MARPRRQRDLRHGRFSALCASCLLAASLLPPAPGLAARVEQQPMPDPAARQAQDARVTRGPMEPGPTVERTSEGFDAASPARPKPRLRLEKTIPPAPSLELDTLATGWEKLNAGQTEAALAAFEKASGSPDALVAQEARLGKAYTLWRQGREDQAEALFRQLVDQDFRVPETLPDLLFLLHKRGGPKAVEPYLHLLPESERDIWRK